MREFTGGIPCGDYLKCIEITPALEEIGVEVGGRYKYFSPHSPWSNEYTILVDGVMQPLCYHDMVGCFKLIIKYTKNHVIAHNKGVGKW